MNIPEVTILFGNQLLRANRARKSLSTSFNFFDTDDIDVLGTVDFGIKLKEPNRKAPKGKLQLGELNNPYLALVRIHPDYRQEEFADVLKEKPDGILIQTYLQSGIKENLKPYIQIAYQQGIPVVVFNPFIADVMNVKGVYIASGISYEALYAKFVWALSSGKSASEVLKLLDKNIAHEFAQEKEGSV
jgi:L-asparaginase/Glu-tRNA(Gln) amidotransferase subunit D